MMLTYDWDGEQHQFECGEGWASRWFCDLILRGVTYPHFDFVGDVQVVLDVGANCGSATTFFARHHPDAEIYSFEPAAEPYGQLCRNTAQFPHVHPLNFGLYCDDRKAELFFGELDSGSASIRQNVETTDESQTVQLRSARGWLQEADLARIDVLKVDTEGCELEILTDMADRLPEIKVIYLEFHSEADRKAIDALLGPTHSLFFGRLLNDTGEFAYVAHDLVPQPGAVELGPLFANLVPE